jgi:hypothetical protein
VGVPNFARHVVRFLGRMADRACLRAAVEQAPANQALDVVDRHSAGVLQSCYGRLSTVDQLDSG